MKIQTRTYSFRLFLCAVALCLPSLVGFFAMAQDAPRLAKFEVAIWPEYDQPTVLVSYRIHLAPDTILPVQISLPIPAVAGAPHAVAKRGPDGGLYVLRYTQSVDGDWASIQTELDALEMQVEFYTALPREGDQRRFNFFWPGGLEIEDFTYEILQPTGATEFSIFPPPTKKMFSDSGLIFHEADLGAKSATAQVMIDVTYTKNNDLLSAVPPPSRSTQSQVPSMPGSALPAAVAPLQTAASATQAPSSAWNGATAKWLLALCAVAVIALTVLWQMERRKNKS